MCKPKSYDSSLKLSYNITKIDQESQNIYIKIIITSKLEL